MRVAFKSEYDGDGTRAEQIAYLCVADGSTDDEECTAAS